MWTQVTSPGQRTGRWPGLEDNTSRAKSTVRTLPASPWTPKGAPPQRALPPAVPDGAQMVQSLLLQDALVLHHGLKLFSSQLEESDPLTGHELTGFPDILTMDRRGAGWWREGMRSMVRTFSTLTPLPTPSPHPGLRDTGKEGRTEGSGRHSSGVGPDCCLQLCDLGQVTPSLKLGFPSVKVMTIPSSSGTCENPAR